MLAFSSAVCKLEFFEFTNLKGISLSPTVPTSLSTSLPPSPPHLPEGWPLVLFLPPVVRVVIGALGVVGRVTVRVEDAGSGELVDRREGHPRCVPEAYCAVLVADTHIHTDTQSQAPGCTAAHPDSSNLRTFEDWDIGKNLNKE